MIKRAGVVVLFVLLGLYPVGIMAVSGRGLGVPPEQLPTELKSLTVRDQFIPSSKKRAGIIHALSGHVVVIHQETKEAYFAGEGDVIFEKDALNTLGESRCRVRLLSEDVVTMASNTQFVIESFKDLKKERRKSSVFSMLRGKAMFYALRLFKYKETRFSLKTPTAVVGIRGTKFGAHVYWEDEDQRSEKPIRVADGGKQIGPYLAQLSPGTNSKSYTDCFSEDGLLDVNGKTVAPGELYRGAVDRVVPTPPGFVKAFEAETEVLSTDGQTAQTGGAEEKSGEKEGEQEDQQAEEDDTAEQTTTVAAGGGGGDASGAADFADNVADTTVKETGSATEKSEVFSIAQGKTAGEIGIIATIITATNSTGVAWAGTGKGPIYQSHGPNVFDSEDKAETLIAFEDNHVDEENYKLVAKEQDATMTTLHVDQFDWGFGSNIVVTPRHDFTYFRGGRYYDSAGNEYLEWGWWEDLSGVDKGLMGKDGSDKFYAALGNIWHLEGDMTHPDYIDFLQRQGQSYTYSGEAKGVYADSSGPDVSALSGAFSCNVDFGSRQVSGFSINADDNAGGHQVHIYNGSGTVRSDAGLEIDGFSGTIGGNPIDTTRTNAGGTFFGARAQGIGGVWNAAGSGLGKDLGAVGEFHGKRPGD
ncbi:FecR domain-containing protein [Thermodesulfobacteriota bacterium]